MCPRPRQHSARRGAHKRGSESETDTAPDTYILRTFKYCSCLLRVVSGWNLRRVSVLRKVHPHRGKPRVFEVYYDGKGRPWTYDDAKLIIIIRLWRDWRRTPVLNFPEDFTGEPESLKWFAETAKREGWHSLTYEEIEQMRKDEEGE